jgi:hypothetical protein
MITRGSRWPSTLLVLLLVGIACVVIYTFRRPILQAAGWALIANENVKSADVIVLTIDSDGGGVLEAADLVHSGLAARVALFVEFPDVIEQEFIRRGVPYENHATTSIRELNALGVGNVERISQYVSGTEDEGPALAAWCDQQRIRSVVVITSPDHSRRIRRVLHRAVKGNNTSVAIHCARYSTFDPDHWWETHDGTRIEIEELEKLLLDIVRHPMS